MISLFNPTKPKTYAPICLFTYNRFSITIETINALKKNDLAQESTLLVFSDGPKNEHDKIEISAIRNYLKSISGFKDIRIYESYINRGLASSIISGVNQVFEEYDQVIVLEDDLILSENALVYFNQALEKYQSTKDVFSISGHTPPLKGLSKLTTDGHFLPRASSWGWATWKDRWKNIDWAVSDYSSFIKDKVAQKAFNNGGSDLTNMLRRQMSGKINSWAIRWCYHQYKIQGLTLYPKISKVFNAGFTDQATHTNNYDRYNSQLDTSSQKKFYFPSIIECDLQLLNSFQLFNGIQQRAIGKIKTYLVKLSILKVNNFVNSISTPKTVLITNIPAPYREKTHEILYEKSGSNYTVLYCSSLEPNRKWNINPGNYHHIFLSNNKKTFIHNNFSVWKHLNKLKPDVVIINGFYPTMLYATLWSIVNQKKLLCFIDGTINSEKVLTKLHQLVRKVVFKKTSAFIGPSDGTASLYKSYNVATNKIFKSPLCVENSSFKVQQFKNKKYDVMFSGQFIKRKMPFFFIEVAKKIKNKLGYCSILLLGDGHLREDVLIKLIESKIDFEYAGFIEQSQLPNYYSLAKLFLFPTTNDPWGVVVNEAMASGTPVITCENAGVAHELVMNNENGYILPLDADIWANHIIELLENETLYNQLAANAYKVVQEFNHEKAAKGILDAIKFATVS